jgi:predicted DNA-binding transcriptional regulator YafY
MPSDTERKLALLDLLAARRGRTVEEIFEALPSFYPAARGEGRDSAKKKFERDKEDLAAMGFPLLAEQDGADETYRLDPPDPALPTDFVLTPGETATLEAVLADPFCRAQLPEASLSALVKLHELYTPISAAAPPGAEPPPGAALVSKILAAVDRERALDVDYPGRDGKVQRRTFSPWRLILKRGRAYLLAFCHRDGFPKMLTLSRMGRVAASREDHRAEPAGFDARRYILTQDYLPEGSADWRVRLRVGPSEAWRLEETARAAVVARDADGGREAVFGVSNREAFFRYVSAFGRHAEILEPPEAREAFRAFLEEGAP